MADDPNPERMLVENLALVEETVRWIARRRGFSIDEREEFAGVVRLRLVEDDYRILRAFRGRSSLRSYLITVIQRLALDFVIAKTGKWRPSALALREGDHAVRLEELIYRRGMTPEQAVDTMIAEPSGGHSREQLIDLAGRLPVRQRPRQVEDEDDALGSVPDPETPVGALEKESDSRQATAIGDAFRRAFSKLAPEDRLLLKLRYESGLNVPQIAASVRIRPKRLYKRYDRLLDRLRRELGAVGLAPESAAAADRVLPLVDLWPDSPPGRGESRLRPSPSTEDEEV